MARPIKMTQLLGAIIGIETEAVVGTSIDNVVIEEPGRTTVVLDTQPVKTYTKTLGDDSFKTKTTRRNFNDTVRYETIEAAGRAEIERKKDDDYELLVRINVEKLPVGVGKYSV